MARAQIIYDLKIRKPMPQHKNQNSFQITEIRAVEKKMLSADTN